MKYNNSNKNELKIRRCCVQNYNRISYKIWRQLFKQGRNVYRITYWTFLCTINPLNSTLIPNPPIPYPLYIFFKDLRIYIPNIWIYPQRQSLSIAGYSKLAINFYTLHILFSREKPTWVLIALKTRHQLWIVFYIFFSCSIPPNQQDPLWLYIPPLCLSKCTKI